MGEKRIEDKTEARSTTLCIYGRPNNVEVGAFPRGSVTLRNFTSELVCGTLCRRSLLPWSQRR